MGTGVRRDPAVDPRIERSRRVIREAALAELAETGYGGFTIESVATRAGVGRSTIYRHWANKVALITDTLETLNEQPDPHLTGGTPRERVECLLDHLATMLASSPFSASVPALIQAAERDPSVRAFHHRYSARRRQTLVDTIVAGIGSGDFPATLDPDIASLALAGAVFYRRLMTGEPFDPTLVPVLADTVLGPGRLNQVPASSPVPGRVIVLTGPPGAGKSTVASLLADRLSPSVHLHSDEFWRFIRQGSIPPQLPHAHRQNEIVIDVLAHAAFGYAAGGYQVICDGVIGPWFIDVFRDVSRAHGIALHYIILRPAETTTLQRATNRGADALTDAEPVRMLHRQFINLGHFEGHTLDSTRLNPQETADAVLELLATGTCLLTVAPPEPD